MSPSLWSNLYILMMATFLGMLVIRRVSPLLHTPLMSLTNAISAIAIVGALTIAGRKDIPAFVSILGSIAVLCSMINIVGGYLITYRMLKMFKKREPVKAAPPGGGGGILPPADGNTARGTETQSPATGGAR